MIIAAVVGILGTNPAINLPAFTGWTNSFNGQVMFPYLFITVACGAISGFHSLIASGTTSKQLNNEGDAKLIGYGSMLIECVLAVIALIAVGALFSNGKMPQGTPAVVLPLLSLDFQQIRNGTGSSKHYIYSYLSSYLSLCFDIFRHSYKIRKIPIPRVIY